METGSAKEDYLISDYLSKYSVLEKLYLLFYLSGVHVRFFRVMSSPCEILEAFEEYGLAADNKSLLEALTNICTEYNLDAEGLSDKWLQFTLNSKVANTVR